jgi:membrane-associated protein
MNIFSSLIDFLLHVDANLISIISQYGLLVYPILFLIILVETGLVIMPFLPGDSLLFVSGTLAAAGSLNVFLLFILLAIAAILGDSINYAIGSYLGPKVFKYPDSKLFKKQHLIKTQQFYEKHGGKTIIIARFMPFVRTFAPFVAGIGRMQYARFLAFNITGGILWTGLFLFAGFFFGEIPLIKNNLTLVIIIIIFLSLLPGIIAYLREKLKH